MPEWTAGDADTLRELRELAAEYATVEVTTPGIPVAPEMVLPLEVFGPLVTEPPSRHRAVLQVLAAVSVLLLAWLHLQ